ncbi:AraC family transcriptional regulator [Sphingomonas endophytica]|uniref:AraC family transcriptional regulator n=1 Tax=Sphingomonas endophytica TaxID=869719 RepID=A0A147HZM2_9SPHN|nr:AraC family transcriptional regulator [Sphingomonas endophytica]KTT70433.1 AraC family transcriptional regulator [Sphingomonas endophytica]
MTTLTDLAPLIERHWFAYGRETPIEGLLITRAETPSGIIRAVYRPSFCLVVQGAKTTMLGETRYRYAAGQCLLASVDLPVTARITQATQEAPYLALSLAIDPAVVTELLAELAGALADAPAFAALSTADHDPALCDPLKRLLDLLDAPRDAQVLAPLVRREIVWRLLGGALGPALRQIGLADTHAARIGRATAHIRDHYAETLRVADLAALASMSVPGFHRHFKTVTTMTPVQFQKQVRLQEARRRLIAAEEVARVGFAVGYESLSQFSRDYRRLFGAPPGRDAAAIRAQLAPEPALP